MLRQLRQRQTTTRRALILLALLALLGGNVLEAGHSHAPHEVTADCLLYHASANGTCGGAHAVVADFSVTCATPLPLTAPGPRRIVELPPARGPPAHS